MMSRGSRSTTLTSLRRTVLAAFCISSLAVSAGGEPNIVEPKYPAPAEPPVLPPPTPEPASQGVLPPPAAETPPSAPGAPPAQSEAAAPAAPAGNGPQPTAATEGAAGAAVAPAEPESDEPPPTAKPGECYARVNIPPEVVTVQEQVLKHEAYQNVEVVPPVFQTTEETVLAEYEEVKEQVLVRAGYNKWEKCPPTGGKSRKTRGENDDTEVLCLVEVPPEYQTVTKQVVKKPETTRQVSVTAEYTTVTRSVLKTPATTREVDVPAEYKKVLVTKEVSPAREVKVDVPAEYETVTRLKRINNGRIEWRSILCRADATPAKIMEIQKALKEAGYNPGKIDGVLSTRTFAAIYAYQKAKNLPQDYGNYLNIDTVNALGIQPH